MKHADEQDAIERWIREFGELMDTTFEDSNRWAEIPMRPAYVVRVWFHAEVVDIAQSRSDVGGAAADIEDACAWKWPHMISNEAITPAFGPDEGSERAICSASREDCVRPSRSFSQDAQPNYRPADKYVRHGLAQPRPTGNCLAALSLARPTGAACAALRRRQRAFKLPAVSCESAFIRPVDLDRRGGVSHRS